MASRSRFGRSVVVGAWLGLGAMLLTGCKQESRGLEVDPAQIQQTGDTIAVASEGPVPSNLVEPGSGDTIQPSGLPAVATTTPPGSAASSDGAEALIALSSCGESDDEQCFPSDVSDRKIVDQHGDVYLMRSFSSWSMASNLSNEQITSALEAIRADGFNAVTVWAGGGYALDDSWHRYTNAAGDPFWEGAPWQSALGPAWSSVDWVVSEAERLGMTANLSFCGGNGSTGARGDWEQASDSQMYDVGVDVAERYQGFDNIVWHVMFDDDETPDSVAGQRVDALFDGIDHVEGGQRPIRWAEPNNGSSVRSQLLAGAPFSHVDLSLNGLYQYGSNAAELVEATWSENGAASMAFGDVEPPYDGSPHYSGDPGQQLRERSYAVFLEGGSFINYGHEDWWPFGADGLYSEGLSWDQVPSDRHTIEQSYVWSLIDAYVADRSWLPDDGSFLTSGEEGGDTKAAVGRSATAAIAYFPSPREVTVDTTVLAAPAVRLRWYDPTLGTFTVISASEAPTADRAIDEFPSNHADGTSDWVLVVDAA